MDARHEPFTDDEPAGSLADLLDDVARFLRRFVVFQSRAQSDAVALWVAHTYVLDAADQTPYLHVRSAQKRSGKSLLLELLALVVHAPWATIGPSEAVLFRMIESRRPTLILDEIDTVFRRGNGRDENTEGLRGVLNAGCRRGASIPRCVPRGKTIEIQEFSVFCPKALGGIGTIPDTIADRSIRIELKRKKPSDGVERFRPRLIEPEAEPIRHALELWAATGVTFLTGAEPRLPEELHDRAQDAWEPLLAIADLAGGSWPARARDAAKELTPSDVGEDEIGVQLLADCREIFGEIGQDRLHTKDLLDRLKGLEVRPWSDWSHGNAISARKVAGLLGAFGIRPTMIRIDLDSRKGYYRAAFDDAWSRYLPPPPVERSHVNSAGQNVREPSSEPSSGSQVNSAGHTLFSADSDETPQVSDQRSELVNVQRPSDGGNGTSRAPMMVVEDRADWQPCSVCGRPCPTRIEGVWRHVACPVFDANSASGIEEF